MKYITIFNSEIKYVPHAGLYYNFIGVDNPFEFGIDINASTRKILPFENATHIRKYNPRPGNENTSNDLTFLRIITKPVMLWKKLSTSA